MTSLKTKVANIDFETCIWNASGCWCTQENELDELYQSEAGAVVSKSGTMEVRSGNEEPRFHSDNLGTINSMGVPNLGYQFYTNYRAKIIDKPYIQSLIPFSIDDMEQMLTDINENLNDLGIVEINLSCPNIVSKSIVAYDMEAFELYLIHLNDLKLDKLTVGLKLPPYYEIKDFVRVSKLILKYNRNIKFITCINSIVNGLLIDTESESTKIYPKIGLGGIGGIYCLPTALANVRNFYNLLGNDIDIIACGGVSKGEHAFQHILCGASAVEVGSQLMKEGPDIFAKLNAELKAIMETKGYTKISDFRGKLKVIESK